MMIEPTDDELIGLFSSADGDGSSYDGWLAIWRAGYSAGTGRLTRQFRAVFSYPPSTLGATRDSYGEWRETYAATEKDQPWRPEESLGWRSGTQTRLVSEPEVFDA